MNKHEEKPEPGTDVEARRSGKSSSSWLIKAVLTVSVSINIGLGTWVVSKVQTMSENIATLVAWKSEGERADTRCEQAIALVAADVKDHGNRIVVLETKAGVVRQ